MNHLSAPPENGGGAESLDAGSTTRNPHRYTVTRLTQAEAIDWLMAHVTPNALRIVAFGLSDVSNAKNSISLAA